MESFDPRESSVAAGSLRKLIATPGVSGWHYGSCRRCLLWPASRGASDTSWRELALMATPLRLTLPRARPRQVKAAQRPYVIRF